MRAAVLYENSEVYVEGSSRRYPDLPLRENPLVIEDVATPIPRSGQVLIEIEACGVCYTDIDTIEGRVKCNLPIIPGHQVVGRIVESPSETGFIRGDRVGVAWIYNTCGTCEYCRRDLENLCIDFQATGCHYNGGYAEYMVAYTDYIYRLPLNQDPVKLAPLLCAGAVGYRALRLVELKPGERIGLFGFGASAHILLQVLKSLHPDVEVYVFTRSRHHQEHARKLGSYWVGNPFENPPRYLDKAIDFTPAGEIIPRALEVLRPGGRLVVNVIRKQSQVILDYEKHLWREREIKSVANVTRRDIKEFIEIASRTRLEVDTVEYSLSDANRAIRDVKSARVKGSAVLRIH